MASFDSFQFHQTNRTLALSSSATVARPGAVEEEATELRRKIAVLQGDQRASKERLHKEMESNTRSIAALRQQNKNMRFEISAVTQNAANDKITPKMIAHQNNRVAEMRKRMDSERHRRREKELQMQHLQQQLIDLQADDVDEVPDEATEEHKRQIRMTENRLEKLQVKHEEAMTIHKTYLHIQEKLSQDRLTYDRTLEQLKELLTAKRAELAKLKKVKKDALQARDEAKVEQQRMEEKLAGQRLEQEQEVEAHREEVRRRMKAMEEVEARRTLAEMERERRMSEAAAQGDPVEELALLEKIDHYGQVFRRLEEVTGSTGTVAVVEQLTGQRKRKEQLDAIVEERRKSKEEAEAECKRVQQEREVVCLKHTPATIVKDAKSLGESVQTQLSQVAQRQRALETEQQRHDALLLDTRLGVEKLTDVVHAAVGQGAQTTFDRASEAYLPDMLRYLQGELGAVYDQIARMQSKHAPEVDGVEKAVPKHNTRISMSRSALVDEPLGFGSSSPRQYRQRNDGESSDEESGHQRMAQQALPTREQMKKLSTKMVEKLGGDARQRSGRRKPRLGGSKPPI